MSLENENKTVGDLPPMDLKLSNLLIVVLSSLAFRVLFISKMYLTASTGVNVVSFFMYGGSISSSYTKMSVSLDCAPAAFYIMPRATLYL